MNSGIVQTVQPRMAPELIYTFECERIVRGWMRSRKRSDSTEFERASADSSNARFVPRSRRCVCVACHPVHGCATDARLAMFAQPRPRRHACPAQAGCGTQA